MLKITACDSSNNGSIQLVMMPQTSIEMMVEEEEEEEGKKVMKNEKEGESDRLARGEGRNVLWGDGG